MKPYIHARHSVKHFDGNVDDYIPIHTWMDSTKAHVPDMRHRVILHNSFGIFLGEQVFGATIENSDGKTVSVRDILEKHVVEDLGFIPSLERALSSTKLEKFIVGVGAKRRGILAGRFRD